MGNVETAYDGPVIAQYDVRGIQEYIFRSNRLKEIVGASYIVEQIFSEILYQIIKGMVEGTYQPIELENTRMNQYIFDWKEDRKGYLFDCDNRIQMEILFANAGNATILYRRKALCIAINKKFTQYILENVAGLRISIGIAKKTDCYNEDYKRLVENLQKIKASMPNVNLEAGLPIIKCETSTGISLSKYSKEREEFVSIETYNKLLNYQKLKRNTKENENHWKQFDKLIEQKGESSLLAIVHIDGNNMGSQIGKLMKDTMGYSEAIQKMKQISYNINTAFNDKAFCKIISVLKNWIHKQENEDIPYHRYMRKIINAGDDITFICTAKIAIALSKIYLNEVSKHSLIEDENNFSACAGIAIINSHFPFYEGYKVAEMCCKQAKEKAKKLSKDKNNVGNWIDFQICKNMYLSSNFEAVRDYQYRLPDNTYLLKRPYVIASGSNVVSKELQPYNFMDFTNHFNDLVNKQKISRHWLIELRNAYCEGEREVYFIKNRIKASGFEEIRNLYSMQQDKKTAQYFDVLEMLDLYEELEEKEELNENL